ncbi:sugar ABC transporter substrate-binding protein [Streptomyces carpinensis]|uniref:Substrate-binding domain-containing protein n=1 Tax=Streptomyces carpinensis TaxID=66369 RepID=A0ABV1VWF2_9ACTN|nr:substrate-binding domain-containing protein [Streptomyces carpinensis]
MAATLMAVTACGGASNSSGAARMSDQQLATFKAAAEKAEAPQTTWNGPTSTPKPPKGITLAVVSCANFLEGCARQVAGTQAAGRALGWAVKVYDGKGDPVAQNQALIQAINGGANAVLLAGTDPRQVAAGLQLAREKKIPVGTMGVYVPPSDLVAFDINDNFPAAGKAMASWVVADSQGAANVLPMNDKEFPSTDAQIKAARATLKSCTSCVVQNVEQHVATDIGNGLGQRMSDTLRRQPDVNYVIGSYDAAISDMVPALTNAGIAPRIKAVGYIGNRQNLGYVKDGNVEHAVIAEDDRYYAYAAVDQLIRVLNGKRPWRTPGDPDDRTAYSEGVPFRLLTAASISDPRKPWAAENDYVSRYLKLWGIS